MDNKCRAKIPCQDIHVQKQSPITLAGNMKQFTADIPISDGPYILAETPRTYCQTQ
ncbi:MAG: hypothetical protein R2822_17505 [Spirosomataceae bacterium]